ncbi:hypothetical protein L6164_022659 [Bauhinia variegata]|uniref:Uncharacterized protein n=1 Tax=Bauhinia variegata TaxID=167791 RepID=A0ACB9MGA1_BAUVA|nr:hypothetical protein L6164_022659 [Bauhinia variegata]
MVLGTVFSSAVKIWPASWAATDASALLYNLMENQHCSYPLLVKAARGDPVSRPPPWMIRQAGRCMAVYRNLAEKYPSFRERSETNDLLVEISLQPWKAFRPDGVIIFSDILHLYLHLASHLT